MKRFVATSLVLLVLSTAAACEKAGDSTKIEASGALSKSERSLLAHLPPGANLVFGGDYEKFAEYWHDSPLKKLSDLASVASGDQNAMRDYMNCWIERDKGTELVGSMQFKDSGIQMSMLFRGIEDKTLTTCADKGGFQYKKDADGKYIELQGIPDGLGGTSNAGYYFVDPSTAFFAIDFPLDLAAGGRPAMPSRQDLEERLAKAAADPAVDRPELKALLEKADRSKAFWFSGSTAGTPLADKLGGGHGWIDADKSSLTFGFSVELSDAETASTAVAKFKEAKDSLGLLPPELKEAAKSFLDEAKLTSSGKTLNGRFRVTNEMLDKVLPAIQGMVGGGL